MSPLFIKLALAYHTSPAPEQQFTMREWGSPANTNARKMLADMGLIDEAGAPTERLRTYAQALQEVSVPYLLPTRDGEATDD